MQDFLMRCFYDGMTINEAVSLYLNSTGKMISKRSIDNVKIKIKKYINKDWE